MRSSECGVFFEGALNRSAEAGALCESRTEPKNRRIENAKDDVFALPADFEVPAAARKIDRTFAAAACAVGFPDIVDGEWRCEITVGRMHRERKAHGIFRLHFAPRYRQSQRPACGVVLFEQRRTERALQFTQRKHDQRASIAQFAPQSALR